MCLFYCFYNDGKSHTMFRKPCDKQTVSIEEKIEHQRVKSS